MRNLTRALISVSTAGVLIGGAGYGVAAAGTSYEKSDDHSHSKSDDSDDDSDGGDDSDGDSHSDHDSVEGDGVFALGKFTFKGRNTSDDPRSATGYFRADATAPANALVALRGPITCIVVQGNRAGFLYPVKDDSMPGLIKGTVVMISLEDGGPGGKDRIGFIGPAPAAAFPNCNPGLTPFDVTSGDVTVHDGS